VHQCRRCCLDSRLHPAGRQVRMWRPVWERRPRWPGTRPGRLRQTTPKCYLTAYGSSCWGGVQGRVVDGHASVRRRTGATRAAWSAPPEASPAARSRSRAAGRNRVVEGLRRNDRIRPRGMRAGEGHVSSRSLTAFEVANNALCRNKSFERRRRREHGGQARRRRVSVERSTPIAAIHGRHLGRTAQERATAGLEQGVAQGACAEDLRQRPPGQVVAWAAEQQRDRGACTPPHEVVDPARPSNDGDQHHPAGLRHFREHRDVPLRAAHRLRTSACKQGSSLLRIMFAILESTSWNRA